MCCDSICRQELEPASSFSVQPNPFSFSVILFRSASSFFIQPHPFPFSLILFHSAGCFLVEAVESFLDRGSPIQPEVGRQSDSASKAAVLVFLVVFLIENVGLKQNLVLSK